MFLHMDLIALAGFTISVGVLFLGTATLLAASTSVSYLFYKRKLHSLKAEYLEDVLVIMPLDRWSTLTKKGLALAVRMTGHIRVVHVPANDGREQFKSIWKQNVVAPLLAADMKVPELVLLEAKGGAMRSIVKYILGTERLEPNRQIVVIVPELSLRHWWQKPFHNNQSRFLKFMLSTFGSTRIMIIDVPWHLS